MLLKKSNDADLEKKRGMFLQIGLILSLSLALLAFNHKTKPDDEIRQNLNFTESFLTEEIESTIREKSKPTPLKIPDIITFVPDDTPIDIEIDFPVEGTWDTEVFYPDLDFEPEKIIEKTYDFLPYEDMPTFNGGDPSTEFRKFIMQNVIYPEIAISNGIGGIVYVQFTINSKGQLVDPVVVRSVDAALDKEAIRVISESPLWTPGKQGNTKVSVRYTFPIKFTLM